MKYKFRKSITILLIYLGATFCFLLSLILFQSQNFSGTFFVSACSFIILFLITDRLKKHYIKKLDEKVLNNNINGILYRFIDKMRSCFTISDLIKNSQFHLEKEADATILLFKSKSKEILYASPSNMFSAGTFINDLRIKYFSSNNGLFFFDKNTDLCSKLTEARGFYIKHNDFNIFIFMKVISFIDIEALSEIITEFKNYLDRLVTIERMFEISALSNEWELVAETQRSFLPKTIPECNKLDIAAYFRPLVNVSGDYYDIIPLDKDKTLILLGDVSGKGLASALIMGIIINTVRISSNKTNLPLLIKNIDSAIKSMQFEDKYTVLFLGIIDIQEKKLSYINASMSDPVIISQSAVTQRVTHIESNCPLIGIIPIDDVVASEISLRSNDLILIASDGISEVVDEKGIQFGDTEKYMTVLKKSSVHNAEFIIEEISNMALNHAVNGKLKDDVTMVAIKVGQLWD